MLTDCDIAGASEKIRHGINEFAKMFRMKNHIETEPVSQNGGGDAHGALIRAGAKWLDFCSCPVIPTVI